MSASAQTRVQSGLSLIQTLANANAQQKLARLLIKFETLITANASVTMNAQLVNS